MKFRLTNIISVFCLFCVIACQHDSQDVSQEKIISPQGAAGIQKENLISEKEMICTKEHLHFEQTSQISFVSEQEVLVKFFDESLQTTTDFARFLEHLSVEIFDEKQCDFAKITVQNRLKKGVLFTGRLTKENHFFYGQKKISLPEFQRRFEITEETTLELLKERLKTARDQKNSEEALSLIAEWLEQDPENAKILTIKGNVFLEEGRFLEAIPLYERVLEKQPDLGETAFSLAVAKKEAGLFQEAISDFERLKGSFVDQNFLSLHLAEAYFRNQEIDEAKKVLGDLQGEEPNLLRAELFRAEKKLEEAKVLLEKYPDHPVALYNLTLLFMDLRNTDEAMKSFLHLKQMAPEFAKELEFIELFSQKTETN